MKSDLDEVEVVKYLKQIKQARLQGNYEQSDKLRAFLNGHNVNVGYEKSGSITAYFSCNLLTVA